MDGVVRCTTDDADDGAEPVAHHKWTFSLASGSESFSAFGDDATLVARCQPEAGKHGNRSLVTGHGRSDLILPGQVGQGA